MLANEESQFEKEVLAEKIDKEIFDNLSAFQDSFERCNQISSNISALNNLFKSQKDDFVRTKVRIFIIYFSVFTIIKQVFY